MALFKQFKKTEKGEKSKKEIAVPVSEKINNARGVFSVKSLPGILLYPRVTEKAVAFAEKGVYVFVVSDDANKIQIKRAVEGKYGVHVADVRVVRLPGKERRRGRVIGWKAGFKKAMVQLKEGQKIEVQ